MTRTYFKTVTKKLKRRDLSESTSFQVPVDAATFKKLEDVARGLAPRNMPVAEVEPMDDETVAIEDYGLFARQAGRHLCPVCPKGVALGKTNGGSNKYCCPARKTVYKTVKKTSTKIKATSTKVIKATRTKTVTVRSFGVQVYQVGSRSQLLS